MDKERLKNKKIWLIAAAILGIVLMVVPGLFPESEESKEKAADTVYYSEILEKKLKELITSAEGVGEATVVVTLDTSLESVYATNEKRGEGSIAVEYVIINTGDGEEPVPVSEIYPRVRGVAVVCSGGAEPEVQKRVTELICAALGISSNKIAVSG
ncbi:MAG: hypothetical protein E7647_08795 [Ruminococcaceae bacterium]|nr:hypothetical protein [Oscillospiraceae bacterium]